MFLTYKHVPHKGRLSLQMESIQWSVYHSLTIISITCLILHALRTTNNFIELKSCTFINYVQKTLNYQAAFSLCILSIYRFLRWLTARCAADDQTG